MNVLFLSPGYPAEMQFFARGLARTGAQVIGIGDQDESALPEIARRSLSAYFRCGSFSDEDAIVGQVRDLSKRVRIHRVESVWEPLMILAAKIREALGIPGMTIEETVPFRDKEIMKQVLDRAGIRTPHHYRCRTGEEIRQAASKIGFPLIVKPIAGAGSADTYRVDRPQDLERAIALVTHVREVSVEEFIDGEEFTFDTICARGRVLYYNICWYRPRPLESRLNEWISPQMIALKDLDVPHLQGGRKMGFEVLEAMRYGEGFTHMEWYLKPNGETVFGEIAARPPGVRTVDLMNFVSDTDLFQGWAEAMLLGKIIQPTERIYNVCNIFKRAIGRGRIQRVEGLSRLLADIGEHIVVLDLLPIGARRRDHRMTVLSDGQITLRHPDLRTTLEMSDRVGVELQLHAG